MTRTEGALLPPPGAGHFRMMRRGGPANEVLRTGRCLVWQLGQERSGGQGQEGTDAIGGLERVDRQEAELAKQVLGWSR